MINLEKKKIYIITYHYVREIKNSDNPNIKGLEFTDFKKQINFLLKRTNILNPQEFKEIIISNKIPDKVNVLLTFDDGYIDHWQYVFPYLNKKKISGIFYPPIESLTGYDSLDVNKIHFILGKEKNRKIILNTIFDYTKKYLNIEKKDIKFNKKQLNGRYDDNETILIKRLLQRILPFQERKKIIDKLFKKYLNVSEREFTESLYFNEKQLTEMNSNGMDFGSHGVNHFWWEDLKIEDQMNEITKSVEYLKKLLINNNNISVCYPYGSYNKDTLSLLKKLDISFALTTKVDSLNQKNIKYKYEIPRLNTNDFLY